MPTKDSALMRMMGSALMLTMPKKKSVSMLTEESADEAVYNNWLSVWDDLDVSVLRALLFIILAFYKQKKEAVGGYLFLCLHNFWDSRPTPFVSTSSSAY